MQRLRPLRKSAGTLHGNASLEQEYALIRGGSESLAEGLSAEDCTIQSMPDASPVKWHLAHTTWFFETFVLEPALAGYRVFHPYFRVLFNSYYNSVGDKHPRPERGMLSRPGFEEVLAYRRHVDVAMERLLSSPASADACPRDLIELGLNHEQQHQELILTDLKHLLSRNPLLPAYRETPHHPGAGLYSGLEWHRYAEGIRRIGWEGDSFRFDNEEPRHRVFLNAYALADRLVTNGEYLRFVEDDGYRRPELWLSEGWENVRSLGWGAPLYWRKLEGRWRIFGLSGEHELAANEPVCHVSYFEADAYARWAGARLPGEAEWESAAEGVDRTGNFLEDEIFHPLAAPSGATGPHQLFGDVWEWTSSTYGPYPGYRPAPGAVGEYNGKFMCNQYVLRGGSCATPRSHIRSSYRNFFPASARWQFSGVRLARDA